MRQEIIKKQENFLYTFFGSKYCKDAFSKQRKILFLKMWLQYLQNGGNAILQQHMQNHGIIFALSAKKLLYNIKHQFYVDFYTNLQSQNANIILELLYLLPIDGEKKDPKKILEEMVTMQNELDNKIYNIEKQLKDYSLLTGMTTSIIRLLSESIYYQRASSIVNVGNEVGEHLGARYKTFRADVSRNEIIFFSSTFGVIYLGADYCMHKWFEIEFGSSYVLLSSLSKFLLLDLDFMMKFVDQIHVGRETFIKHMDKLEWLLGLFIMLGMNAFRNELATEDYIYLVGNYVVSSLMRSLTTRLFDAKFVEDNKQLSSQSYNFMTGILGHGSSMFGSYICRKIYPTASLFFKGLSNNIKLLKDASFESSAQKHCNIL